MEYVDIPCFTELPVYLINLWKELIMVHPSNPTGSIVSRDKEQGVYGFMSSLHKLPFLQSLSLSFFWIWP